MPFACSICEMESTRICAFCTKDACDMHICEKCGCCSDCCQCEVPLDEPVHPHAEAPVEHAAVPHDEPVDPAQPAASGIQPDPIASAWTPPEAPEAQPAPPEEPAFEPIETPEPLGQ